jgi:nucleotide-binding universal stress UspA family protein
MDTVLLATDGSEYATWAARRAVELADARDATLHVLCVVDRRKLEEPALGAGELATIAAEDHGHECVTMVRELADEAGVTVEGRTCHGVPPDEILAYAEQVDASVVVVGEHGEHAEHFGGVGRAVADRADREVVVVSAAENEV